MTDKMALLIVSVFFAMVIFTTMAGVWLINEAGRMPQHPPARPGLWWLMGALGWLAVMAMLGLMLWHRG